MACSKAKTTPTPPTCPSTCPDSCGCILATSKSAESAAASANAAAKSAELAQTLLKNCLTEATIKPGGGLVYQEPDESGENGGIIVNPSDIIQENGGLAVDSNNKLYVQFSGMDAEKLAALIKQLLPSTGGALSTDEDGKLVIDFGQMTNGQREDLINQIVQEGGGLSVDEDGKLFVDFDSMPTDKFEAMLKSIRVPIWLEANKAFYVNQTTGSDTLDTGRGESADKPFKTIQAAVNYVADNYNMSSQVATISVAAGYDNTSGITLPLYNATTGCIRIVGESSNFDGVKTGYIDLSYAVRYDIYNITARVLSISSGIRGAVQCSSGTVNLYNVCCDMKQANQSTGGSIYCLYSSGGYIRIWALDTDEFTPGVTFDIDGASISGVISVITGGQLQYAADLTYKGVGTVSINVQATNLGLCIRSNSSFAYPGRVPEIVMEEGASVTGARYLASTNAIISVRSAGPDYYPGTTAGSTSSGGQYI